MRRILFVPLTGLVIVLAGVGCASTGALHGGPSALAPKEKAALVQTKERKGEGFRRLWKSTDLKPWALLRWDQDHSSTAPGAPPGLLQNIRDELGRFNQRSIRGEDLVLVVTVYAYDRGGWFSDPSVSYELVARNQKGQAVWVADDEVAVRAELATTLIDSDELLLARDIARKMRQEFGL
jgi:hypothetical protein